jgi:hypothetical protein
MLRDISREDTVEYVLAMLDDMLSGLFELASDAQLYGEVLPSP